MSIVIAILLKSTALDVRAILIVPELDQLLKQDNDNVATRACRPNRDGGTSYWFKYASITLQLQISMQSTQLGNTNNKD